MTTNDAPNDMNNAEAVAWAIGFDAGAASRDAEVAELQKAIKVWKDAHITKNIQCDQLRAQINTLTEALEFCSGTSYIDDAHTSAAEKALHLSLENDQLRAELAAVLAHLLAP